MVVLTQSQTQSQKATDEVTEDEDEEDDDTDDDAMDEPEPRTRDVTSSGTDDDELLEAEYDPRAFHKEWTGRKTEKRKRTTAETNRIRSEKKSKATAATSIVGRRPPPKKNGYGPTGFSTDTLADDEGATAFLDDPIPDYFISRQKTLKKLHESGLRYPPSYHDVDWFNAGTEEKPELDNSVQQQREKKDIRLRGSHGIIPGPIAQWLRDYQVEGVQFLHEKFVKQTGAILGDDMGLGKTIQVIAFLTAAFGKTGTERDAKCMRKIRGLSKARWYPRVLIVCPGTLMQNWEDELSKWGWWEVYKYHGPVKADRKLSLIHI